MDLKEKTISTDIVFKGMVFDIAQEEVLLPNNETAKRQIIKTNGAVSIIPITKEGEIILIKQYRQAVKSETLEFPGGKLEKGEDIKQAALRELREETGYIAKNIKPFGETYPASGYSDEVIYYFICDDLEVKEKQDLDEDEFINIVKVSKKELKNMILNGEIKDSKVMAFGLKYLIENNI